MKRVSRVLALLLCLVMMVSFVPAFTTGASADGTFYGGGTTAGSAANVTWYGKDTMSQKIMQYSKSKFGSEPIDRRSLNTGSSINMTITAHGNRDVYLIPYNSGTVYLDRNNSNSNNPIGKHLVNSEDAVNRWWRWASWVNDTPWTDSNSTAGFFARVKGSDTLINNENTNWHDVTKNPDTKFSWKSYYWVGGNASNTGKKLEIKINANTSLPVGSKGVMWNANGTELTDKGNRIAVTQIDMQKCWMDNGSIGVSEFVIAEPKEVVYELNGGTLSGQTGNIGYICWNTNDKVTSQLHDIIGEPTRDDGYIFVGWECIASEGKTVAKAAVSKEHIAIGNIDNKNGNTAGYDRYYVSNEGAAVEVGKVYQTKDQNGNATTLTVLGNVVFRAKWVKALCNIAHVQSNTIVNTEGLKLTDYGSYAITAYDKEKQFASNGSKLDITKKVSSGYLYGGTFKEDYATVADFNGGKATAFVPKFTETGYTYYIWEVSDEHLNPKTICTWAKNDGKYDVKGIYLVTAVDRTLYNNVGFTVNSADSAATPDSGKVAFEKVYIEKAKASYSYYDLYKASTTSKSYIACYQLTGYSANTDYTVTPYWVTLDGVRVTGPATRVFQYQGAGSTTAYQQLKIVSDSTVPSNTKQSAFSGTEPLMLMSTSLDCSLDTIEADSVYEEPEVPEITEEPEVPEIPEEPEVPEVPEEPEVPEVPEEPEVPEVPEEPEVPELPEEPEVPEVPEETEVNNIVTVVDGNNSYEVEAYDNAVSIEPVGFNGKIFAGWYKDEAYTDAADLANVSGGDTIYAKYVSDKYLQVKHNSVLSVFNKQLSFTTAVENENFKETGFIVSVNGQNTTVVADEYDSRFVYQNAGSLFGGGVASNAPLMTGSVNLNGLKKNSTITVTPYWVTEDGTTVYGTARILTYNGVSIRG